MIGAQTARDLFGSLDPVGRMVRLGRQMYRVLGVLEEKGASPFGQSQDEIVLMPITTMRSHVIATRPGEVHAILLSSTSAETSERARQQAEAILRQRHRIGENDEDDFAVRSQAEFQAMQDAIFAALSALLVSIAAVSLVVGGIGVMNIMLVSVTERTRRSASGWPSAPGRSTSCCSSCSRRSCSPRWAASSAARSGTASSSAFRARSTGR